MKRALVAIALVLGSSAVFGQAGSFHNGNKLFSDLNSTSPHSLGYAMGYIIGVHDAFEYEHCSPKGATVGQVQDVVKKWLVENPALRDLPAHAVVLSALARAWPCPKPQPKPAPTPEKPGAGKQGS